MTALFHRTQTAKIRAQLKRGDKLTCAEGEYLASLLLAGDLIHVDEAEELVVGSIMSGLTVADQDAIRAYSDISGLGVAATVLSVADEALRRKARDLRNGVAA